jgi:hypothetical protein
MIIYDIETFLRRRNLSIYILLLFSEERIFLLSLVAQ